MLEKLERELEKVYQMLLDNAPRDPNRTFRTLAMDFQKGLQNFVTFNTVSYPKNKHLHAGPFELCVV